MKIGVCSLVIGEKFSKDVEYGTRSRIAYCQKHGYDYIDDSGGTDFSRHLAWSKIPAILKYLPKYDYLVWIDSDTLIMNPEKKLEDFITRLMDGKELMYVASLGWVNTGVMFIKNTLFMLALMKESWYHTDQICWEQGAIDYLYRTNWYNCRSVIKIVEDQTEFNSLWWQYRWGHFLVHFPGCGEPNKEGVHYRVKNCLQRMMDMFCILKKDDETQEDYEKRLEKIKAMSYTQQDYWNVLGANRYLPLPDP